MNCPASAALLVGPTSVGQPPRAVVLGIGNTILSDEAAGVRAVEALERGWQLPENVLAIDGGTSGMEMIEELSNLDFLIVLDVVKTGAAPGTVVKIAGDEIPVFFRSKLSPHQIALPDVLASLELLDTMPKEIVVLGVEFSSLELGTEMTPTIAAKVPVLAAMAAAELAVRGYALEALVAA
jgi:hydrogenase maturation protease